MSDRVLVRATRAFRVRGDVVAAGATVSLELRDAQLALESGRGALVNQADAACIRHAAAQATAHALKLEGRRPPPAPAMPSR